MNRRTIDNASSVADIHHRPSLTVAGLFAFTFAFSLLCVVYSVVGSRSIPLHVLTGAMTGRLIAGVSTRSKRVRWCITVLFSATAALVACLHDIAFAVPVGVLPWLVAVPVFVIYGLLAAIVVEIVVWFVLRFASLGRPSEPALPTDDG